MVILIPYLLLVIHINKLIKNNMKRKHLYPIMIILLITSWIIVAISIVYIFYPDIFKSTERIYYEPDTNQQQ
jgi:hypothetical protein